MADMMQVDLVTPERKLLSVQAREVHIPGVEGDMTVMPAHTPIITSLRPGILAVVGDAGTTDFAVIGGFAEVSASGISILAERAHLTKEVTQEMIDDMVAHARKAHTDAHPDVVDVAAKFLADLVAMGGRIGLEPKV